MFPALLPSVLASSPTLSFSLAQCRPAGRRPLAAAWWLTLLVLLLRGAATTAWAQASPPPDCSQDEKFINTWYFGYKSGLDFNQATDSIPPTVLTNSQMVAPAGSGIMANGSGNILFYSNGDTVWSANHSVMLNGTGMGGNRLVTDGPLAIKLPGSPTTPGGPTRYLLFTQDAQGGPKGLSYSEIEIPTGGQGQVLAATKNTPLTLGTAEKMTGVFHKNGCDIWIIVHGWGTATSGTANRGDSFLAYRVTPTGVQTTPIISTIGAVHAPGLSAQGYRGQMKVSPDGEQLAVARYNTVTGDSTSTVELFAFDAATGVVSNRRIIDATAGRYYGVEFSPSRSRLYATVQSPPQLLQFDLSATNIPASRQVIPLNQTAPVNLGSMQAAPDGKIYVARENQPALGFIAYPDSLGALAAYADDSLQLGGRRSGLGLPNFNQSSLLRVGFGGESTACQEITFQAASPIPNPQSYAWNFGDPGSGTSNTSAVANPVHVFTAPGIYTVTLRITNFCFCREIQLQVPVPGPPTPGSIGTDQTLCAGGTPAPLTSTAAAGAGTGQFSYQWQSSPNNSTWTDIGGATAPGYAPGALTATTYFRRLVTSGFCGPRTPTAAVTITVLPALAAGSIGTDQTICAGTAPALTSSAPATGGTGTYNYQWESSPDNISWTIIPAATSANFSPGPLTVTTYFRRQVSSGPCATGPSNTVTITVVPGLVAGSIAADQTVCAGVTPAPLSSVAPATGGTGTIDYQWESSPNNATWTAIGGATGATYAPGALTATTYFRRRASSGSTCAPVFSNVITITVSPAPNAGTIAADQTICAGATPAAIGGSGVPGILQYQWESSPNNSTWTALPGATGTTYTPGPLTATTYFRRAVTSSACGPVYSNTVVITVLPTLNAGSIAADQTVCAGATPAPLSSGGGASGGTGTYAYQWESSLDNVTWVLEANATSPTFAPGPLSATTYYRRRVVSGTGSCSTAVSNVVTIQVQPLVTPGVTLTAPAAQCAGTVLTFTALATNAGSAPTYQWFVNNVAVASGATFSSSTLVTGDQVRVEVTATPGLCSTGLAVATATVTRLVPAPVALTIAAQPGGPACQGDRLTFGVASLTGSGPLPAYQWQVDGADVAGATNATFSSTTLRDGQTVTLRVRATDACGQTQTVTSNSIVVQILPPITLSAGPDKEIFAGTSVTLEGTASGNFPVTWTPRAGLSFPNNDQLRPVASPLTTTTYTLSAGSGNCATSSQVTVTVRQPIRIPNAFSPNSDNNDDTWQIDFIDQFPENTVTVFNRWGTKIFSATNYSRANEWRGDINGQPAPFGTYYYVIVTKGPLGKAYTGWVQIIR
ncbi:MAG TPA: gliding motility-associated C-terminal domain-containing protein [Hymenobacter sp.]|uniref:T9SS type B sorting domain-containing protein n=1 Tax=Hymenobacter sp. TaxID=1898978 RepID=UPI002D80DEEC|nr:gliding motility-associated C-terminal domain-containing protein [Hymenobacter sp.]HET9506219.1 gliding motility-associated C-terminal domain-containing protein [Hymenobacter sp.]